MRVRDVCQPWSVLALPLLLAFPAHAQSDLAALLGVQRGSLDLKLRTANDSQYHIFELNPGLPATSEDPNGAKSIPVDAQGSPLHLKAECADADRSLPPSSREGQMPSCVLQQAVPDGKTDLPADGVKASSALIAQHHQLADRNLDIYYRNRREFSLDVGWHPINIPFIYDFAAGDSYNMTPLKYTLVPIVASLRWHVTNVGWKWIFRGNMDFTFSGSITAIPRGPETHYYSFDFGIRRNFVYRNWKVVPFFEQRGGAGIINAKEPLGVLFAQGQNLTFTYNLGVGARYNLNSKYSFSAGMNYMHISNGYLSQPQFYNYGINVYGPMFGFDMRLGKPRQHASE
jgi:Lipid A 3-O-deacylase (PagL)